MAKIYSGLHKFALAALPFVASCLRHTTDVFAPASLQGDWKCFSTKLRSIDLTMQLRPDGTFDWTNVIDKTHRDACTGRYTVGTFAGRSGPVPDVELLFEVENGKKIPSGIWKRFLYDASTDTLTDLLVSAFSRPDKAPAFRRAVEAQRRQRRHDYQPGL